MAFVYGFWANGTPGNVLNMNQCLLGWGLYSEFPAPVAGNKGFIALATDHQIAYYSNGSAWVPAFVCIDGAPSQGDILYFDGTKMTRLAPGTAGQVLKTGGAGADPSWTSPVAFSTRASRAYAIDGTVYHNATVLPIMVVCNVNLIYNTADSFNPPSISAKCDAATTPTTEIDLAAISSPSAVSIVADDTLTFIVPPSYYYSLTTANSHGTLVHWYEYT